MKKLLLAAVISLSAAAAFAGGPCRASDLR